MRPGHYLVTKLRVQLSQKGGKAQRIAEKGSGHLGHHILDPWPLPLGLFQVHKPTTPLYWVSQLEWDFLFLAVGYIVTDLGPEIVT